MALFPLVPERKYIGRVRASFPVNVEGEGGIDVVKVNGVWTISPKWDDLGLIDSEADVTNKQVWTYDDQTGVYNRMRLPLVVDVAGTVRYDVAQSLSDAEKLQARTNIAAMSGPGTVTDEDIVLFDGASGNAIKSGGATVPEAKLPARLRGVMQTITDWDTATATGWYSTAGSGSGGNVNGPPGVFAYVGTTVGSSTNFLTQTAWPSGAGSGNVYRRDRSSGSWGSWYLQEANPASAANVRAAAANKVITADLLETASALVTLTDAATIALDWDTGINFDVTLTTDRVLGNPTNGQPGTWRTVLVKSDGGPDTLTFGNQYGGTVPTITDVTTSQFYLLSIYCKTATQFLVTSIDGSDA